MILSREEWNKRVTELREASNNEFLLYKEALENNDREKAGVHADNRDNIIDELKQLLWG
ncbi:hypothetical protein [Bacillus phage SWEP1]|nr:hypothetical protein [Bacillus phage SWEP1]